MFQTIVQTIHYCVLYSLVKNLKQSYFTIFTQRTLNRMTVTYANVFLLNLLNLFSFENSKTFFRK